MSGKRRGRPAKTDEERLQPLCTNLPAPEFAVLAAAARARRVSLSHIVRDILRRAARSGEFSQLKNTSPAVPP